MQAAKSLYIIGHRGARGLAPENTLASFDAAIAHNADALETDVRVTKDRVPVLMHNDFVQNRNKKISDLTYAELAALHPAIVRLDDFLKRYAKKQSLIIEVKPDQPTQPIAATLKQYFGETHTGKGLGIASFDFEILVALKREFPDAIFIVNERWSGVRATHRAKKLNTTRITMNQLWLWSGFIGAMHKRGFQLSAYTLNNPKKALQWQAYGLFGVVTDLPDLFTESERQ